MAPGSEHLLDWFHISMRITVMRQYVKGLSHHNPEEGGDADRLLRQIKGYLWNGNFRDGHRVIQELVMDLECIETNYPSTKALRKAASEFEAYIHNNAGMIPNYAERRRYGERVSTGLWRAPSMRLWENVLASVNRCSGRSPATVGLKLNHLLPDCPTLFGVSPFVTGVLQPMSVPP